MNSPDLDSRYTQLLYRRSAGVLKVHAVLAVLFGLIGIFVSLLFLFAMTAGPLAYGANEYGGASAKFVMGTLIFVFLIVPHVYLVVSGILLFREPPANTAKVLIVLNLIAGVFFNILLAAFAVANLIQSPDYERGRKTA